MKARILIGSKKTIVEVLIGLLGLMTHWWLAGRGEVYLNSGISFGLMGDNIRWLIGGGGVMVGLGYWGLRGENLGIMVMVVGGVINWIDRLIFGGVRDYWWIPGLSVYNNLADWLIALGVTLAWGDFIWKWQKSMKMK